MEKIVTVFKKVEWNNIDILQVIKEAVQEGRREQPEIKNLKLGDIGLKRVGNHLQINLYFIDPPVREEDQLEELVET
ncbi:hypothetical protein [Anaerobranca gottschalkii]|uniref:Uncharacterized protein n=1 Tax=Anaerobranca gottschalkii DSM 13577 TaxID=1120990 RepID=A0A1H9Y4L6_9FIRM|nr:hypothetical protein [Anaerobranca gottschalkii]SES63699.1 hypothetical protein SAMN03080614_1001160 [Anaerobranca gottschalkii DSM 13577]